MNFPKLGFSPQLPPIRSFDDDPDDLQSAAPPGTSQPGGHHQAGHSLPTTTTATGTLASSTEQPLSTPVLQPEQSSGTAGEDKYGTFREITEQTTENVDDCFGECCS